MEGPRKKSRKLRPLSLEAAQKELAAAKRRVSELEAAIQCFQTAEQSKKRTQQQQQHMNCNNPLVLNGQTLQLILEWLTPEGHFSCSQVCREWRDHIDQPHVWKHVVRTQSPTLLNDIQCQHTKKRNFKAISKSLIHHRVSCSSADQEWNPEPTLEPNEVFLLIEAKEQISGEKVGSWHVTFDQWKSPEESDYSFMNILGTHETVLLPPTELQHDDQIPTDVASSNVASNMVFSARLMRCDTGQSVGMFYEKGFSCLDQEWAFVDLDTLRPNANTDAGVRALALWSKRGYDSMALWLRCNITSTFCSSCCSSTSLPVTNHRRKASFCLNSLDCNFMVYAKRRIDEKFASLREVLVSIEGLDWR
eukprot:scaffold2122_cov122-Cylindrotheca_fusiformis.AAC.4